MKPINKGFTLAELIMVLVIMSIILFLVSVNIGAIIPEERLRAEAKYIGGLLQFARSEAAVKGSNYGIVYDMNKNAMWLLVPANEDQELAYYSGEENENSEDIREKLMYHEMKEPVEFQDIEIGEKNLKTEGIVRIEITPLGTASGHLVHLRDKKAEKSFSVELNALTAMVSYYDHYKEYKEVIDFEE